MYLYIYCMAAVAVIAAVAVLAVYTVIEFAGVDAGVYTLIAVAAPIDEDVHLLIAGVFAGPAAQLTRGRISVASVPACIAAEIGPVAAWQHRRREWPCGCMSAPPSKWPWPCGRLPCLFAVLQFQSGLTRVRRPARAASLIGTVRGPFSPGLCSPP